jgi:very-short-patch-repair endonuclease
MKIELTRVARGLRRRQTEAEAKLWFHLRNRTFRGLKFRRQVPRGSYVADFLCDEAMLIIEVDGSHHAKTTKDDEQRRRFLESLGYKVIRFWNPDVMRNTAGVLDAIHSEASARKQTPSSGLRPPSPQGEKETTASNETYHK